MSGVPYTELFVIGLCAAGYFRLGTLEYSSNVYAALLALLSAGLSVTTLFVLWWGLLGTGLAQAGLFVVWMALKIARGKYV